MTHDSIKHCECGCGQEVARRFVPGHNKRTKVCRRGLHDLSAENVYYSAKTKRGHCKPCKLEWQKQRRKDQPETYWHTQIKYRYKTTEAECIALLAEQREGCAVCNCWLVIGHRDTIIDHCHVTGNVRGILCRRCNTALGMMRESPEIARGAATYLDRHRIRSAA